MSSSTRLLAAGRTFSSVREAPRRYNVVARGGLPQFAVRANPFREPTHDDSDEEAALGPLFQGSRAQALPSRPSPSAETLAAPLLPEQAPLPPAPSFTGARSAMTQGLRIRLMASLLGGLNRRRNSRAGVQEELALDHVRVMRNDLSDADLEVVASSGSQRARARATSAASGSIPWWRAGASWMSGRRAEFTVFGACRQAD